MTTTDTRAATGNITRRDARNGTQTASTTTGAPAPTTNPVQLARTVWGALKANPGASVATIATVAGVPVPTVRRALNALEAAGNATRTPGGHRDGKRAPDAWHAAPTTDPNGSAPDTPRHAGKTVTEAPEDTSSDDTAPSPSDGDGDDHRDDVGTDPADGRTTGTPSAGATIPAHEEDGEGMDPAAVSAARDVLTALGETITRALSALQAGDRDAALAAAETFYSASGKGRRLVRAAVQRRRSASGAAHSAPGQLRAKVAAHLAAYPGKEFTPHEIAKVIGHSAGAIANALDRLAALGQAIETCERPRRFTATDHTTVTATAGALTDTGTV